MLSHPMALLPLPTPKSIKPGCYTLSHPERRRYRPMMLARYPLLIYSLFLLCPALFTFRGKTRRGFVEVELAA